MLVLRKIVSIQVSISANGGIVPPILPGCNGGPVYFNIYYGCPYTGPGTCATTNPPLIAETNRPFGSSSYSQTFICNSSLNFEFNQIFSVDVVPVWTTMCTNGQNPIGLGYVAFTGTITLTVTTDLITCSGTGCLAPMTTVQTCDDGNPCTTNDMQTILNCDASICVPCMGTPVVACTNTVSVACNDGNPCTTNDVQIVESCDNSIICVPCAGTPAPSCTSTVMLPCDDGNPCTNNDMLSADACDNTIICAPCAGTPVTACTIRLLYLVMMEIHVQQMMF
ncbi:MAG: hypothetical protein IPO26_17720 [Saprospiraceae bacterium]|nr:hypothetical protein [Saprospiraceae bacterium]